MEVFVDGSPVLVEPGTTVMQVLLPQRLTSSKHQPTHLADPLTHPRGELHIPGVREAGSPDPTLLLPRAPLGGRELPDVSGGDREGAQGTVCSAANPRGWGHYTTHHLTRLPGWS